MRRRSFLLVLVAVSAAAVLPILPIVGQTQEEQIDVAAFARIREEGLQRSQVMDITSYLTDVHGPRLTNSPNIRAAAQWTTKKMTEWGLANVKLEPWGPFGPGWSNERFYAGMVTPHPFPLIGYSKAWSPGTNGMVKADVAIAIVNTQADIEKYRGTLRGKIVMRVASPVVVAQFQPPGVRYSDQQLETLQTLPQRGGAPRGGQQAQQPPAAGAQGQRGGGQNQPAQPAQQGQQGQQGRGAPAAAAAGGGGGQRGPQQLNEQQRNQFFMEEGVVAVLEHGGSTAPRGGGVRGTGGTLFVQAVGNRTVNAPPMPPQIVIAAEHYGMMFRNVEKNIPVTMELNVENKFYTDDLNSFNVVGEITGTDKAQELVMVGAHFDSWHTGTGATDNASGSAVMMEAMRILKATGLPLRRTVRIALWTGEEQGLFGSQAHVREHFAIRQSMELKPDYSRFSVYFNVDNGTGQIRGVWMEGNEAARALFQAWMQPFKDFGMTTLSPRGTGGTDHTRFDEVGLPGFQFIQDPVEYDTRTHHSNMDVYERIQPKDMMQNAVIVASFVYQAANREQLFPRKPQPAPQPPPGQRGGRGNP